MKKKKKKRKKERKKEKAVRLGEVSGDGWILL